MDLEADGDELLDAIEKLNQIANKKYKESIDQAEKMEKAVSLIGAAMEILKS